MEGVQPWPQGYSPSSAGLCVQEEAGLLCMAPELDISHPPNAGAVGAVHRDSGLVG